MLNLYRVVFSHEQHNVCYCLHEVILLVKEDSRKLVLGDTAPYTTTSEIYLFHYTKTSSNKNHVIITAVCYIYCM